MGDSRRSTRRTSARLADKEDAPATIGTGEDEKQAKANGASSKQPKNVVNGHASSSTTNGGRPKRTRKEYDEEDDGFKFTRTRTKRPKTMAPVPAAEPMLEAIREPPKAAPTKKTRNKSTGQASPRTAPAALVEQELKETKRRRSPRNSGDSIEVDAPPLVVPKKRKENPSKPRQRKSSDPQRVAGEPPTKPRQEPQRIPPPQQIATSNSDVTKIALPFADTPIIRRNQEMRKGTGDGQRRSSLGMRGRRASSLIESGKSNALPHDEVDSSEFYKHIESQSLPEPRRMRQLLTWCGTRALGEKPPFASEDSEARLAAREIQQQLLKDFSTKFELSDWFSRDSEPIPQTPRPNPKNVANLAKIDELEQTIARLQVERQTWSAILRPPPEPSIPPFAPLDIDFSTSLTPQGTATPSSSSTAAAPLPSQLLSQDIRSRLLSVSQNLEVSVDTLAVNVHAVEQYCAAADRLASQVLGAGARGLEEREQERRKRKREQSGREEEGEVGTREVLRGLSRALER